MNRKNRKTLGTEDTKKDIPEWRMIGGQRLEHGLIIRGNERTKRKKLLMRCGKNREEINKKQRWDSKWVTMVKLERKNTMIIQCPQNRRLNNQPRLILTHLECRKQSMSRKHNMLGKKLIQVLKKTI
jgi:hypothetical protein